MAKKINEPCPIPLTSTDTEAIYQWIYEVEKHGQEQDVQYDLEMLCAFVGKYYPKPSMSYAKVTETIKEYYGNFGEEDKQMTAREKKAKASKKNKPVPKHARKTTHKRFEEPGDNEFFQGYDWDERGDKDSRNWQSWGGIKIKDEEPEEGSIRPSKAPLLPFLKQQMRPLDAGEDQIKYTVQYADDTK